ncbi:acyltransferase family protein [Fundicoccus sp. Sow4_D5]|uniref:acyltransferase family protein n=1 Tax=Fundicoccus sp. Sow4_D5 TaxID=3438782 RepID=UPI003F918467
MDNPVIQKTKFMSIDVMKGIAILLVILVHTSQRIEGDMFLKPFTSFGQLGVQMFFLVSAFTLCNSLETRSHEPLAKFYLRRYSRVAPGYYFGIILYFVLTSLFNGFVWDSNKSPLNILANIFLVHGLYLPATNNVVPGGWSIGTEFLFYLIFPFLFLAYNWANKKFKYLYLCLPFIALAISITLEFSLYTLTKKEVYFRNNGFIYYNIVNQIPVFLLGMSLFFAHKNGLTSKINKYLSMSLTLAFSLSAALIMFEFENYIALFPFLAGLSFSFLFIVLQNSNISKFSVLSKMGIYSFTSYLLHFIFTFYFVTLASRFLGDIPADFKLIILYPLAALLTFISSKYFQKYIEWPGVIFGEMINKKF